ncbi:hypothetical protein MNKW57_21210 [Biformimicrobium ophioploci]|uniref:Uncharacterized protein n=1 Tax=Biformimicrobium ophioploci TaxID=3036711 RepID=A0ABQ6M0J9_9GAMM|nr:hypothetical protein MNKW57_21210 [Microbulbifer sp. NKW57]
MEADRGGLAEFHKASLLHADDRNKIGAQVPGKRTRARNEKALRGEGFKSGSGVADQLIFGSSSPDS